MARLGRSRPARNYKIVQPVTQIALGAHGLTTPNLALAAPVPTLTFGNNVNLTTPNIALAAPVPSAGIGPTLTTPNLLLAAPLTFAYQSVALLPSPFIPIPVAGFGYQQNDFIQLWSNAAAFFQQRVVLRVSQTQATTTLPSAGTVTTIAFDTVLEDPYGGWDFMTNNQWTAPFAGFYQITLTVFISSPSAANTALQLFAQTGKSPGNVMNSLALTSVAMPQSSVTGGAEATWTVYLAGGDNAYGAAAIKNSGSSATTSTTNGQNSRMEIVWLST